VEKANHSEVVTSSHADMLGVSAMLRE
jgi:hypothetical protein